MGYDPLHFDEILTATNSTIGELSASLMKMEAKGIIKCMPGNYYVKL
jgi:predicted Rossmann fold nucleotide-binding protein DprA/Smf involved in DNA uptake